jgi:hypothetical protein
LGKNDHVLFFSTKISQWEHPLDEYHKSLYRKQKDEKLKLSAPSKGEHAGKTDKKRQEQDGKTAVVKSMHRQEEAAASAPAAVVLERPKSAARAGIRPSTRYVEFIVALLSFDILQGWACRARCCIGERTSAASGRARS